MSAAKSIVHLPTGYARHVDNLIWCKSIVKDLNTKSITREAQAHNREVMCESSVYQTDELMNKNVIEGADSGRAGPGSRSPSGQTGSVNDAVVSGKGINLSGEASTGGLSELKSAQEQASSPASDGGVTIDRGVSKGHISRGNGRGVVADGLPVQRRTTYEPRSGEGPKCVWQPDLPLEPSHKRRPARGQGEQEQHSQLQTKLLEAIFSSTNLDAAYRRVKANDGAAGVDGVSLTDFTLWFRLRRDGLLRRLHLGNYCPSPVRRTHIAKKNGKLRPLGIPTVFDRIVQQAIHQVLGPILEPSFSEHSHGFRPNCRGHDAVRYINNTINEGFKWSVDIDLKSFFDKVPQARALEALRERLDGDGPVVRLIKRYLQAGYVELGSYRETPEGMPQGGPLSPLLSNLVLDALDKELEKRGHRFVRYADDFVVLLKSERAAHRVFASLCDFIEKKLQLEVNREKSAVRSVKELTYLSFGFRRRKIVVSEDSLAEFKYRLKELSCRNWSVSMDHRMYKIRQYVRGWMGYFGLSAIYSVWLAIDSWLRRRIRMCYWRQWKRPKRRYINMRKLGAKHNEAAGFARTSKGFWRVAKHLGYKAGMTNQWLEMEGLITIKQQWWNVKFLRITALKQTA